MPILGMNISGDFLLRQRKLLLDHLNEPMFRNLFPAGSRFLLSRTPYTGDYILRGQETSGAFFPIAKFGMLPMPGCRKICIFHHAEVEETLRGKGIGKALLGIRCHVADEMDYKIVLCTTRSENAIEIYLLRGFGFVQASWYHDVAKGKVVYLWKRTVF